MGEDRVRLRKAGFGRAADAPCPTAAQPLRYDGREFEALSNATNYYQWILREFSPFVRGRVVEVGAGAGNFSAHVLALPRVVTLLLVEPSPNLFPLLRQRFAQDPRVQLMSGEIEDVTVEADAVILVNVLEHLHDPHATLQSISSRLAPGGHLLLFVPALPWLFGSLDTTYGHLRRYTRSTLEQGLRQASFHLLQLKYFNLPGCLSWYMAGKLFRCKTIQPWSVRLYDTWVVPWISRIERYWTPPLGQSLVAIARK